MKAIQQLLQKQQIQLTLLVITLGVLGGRQQAFASTLTPETILDTWTQNPEVVNGLASWGTKPDLSPDIWGVDTSDKIPFESVTNHKRRIGRSSDADTDQYGSLISDFDLLGNFTFSGSFFMPNDNDIVGLLFGYQDSDNHYRLSWGSNKVARGFDEQGKQLRPHGPYERFDLSSEQAGVDEIGSGGMVIAKEENGITSFYENTFDFDLRWQTDVWYDFSVSRIDESLLIDITESMNSVFSTTITDTTFMSGKVGFNTAGVEVFYGNIVAQENNPQIGTTAVPEPLTILGAGFAIGFGTFFKRKVASTSNAAQKST
ncbi:PEP-CTERM sorting domain-containing protein [Crocosphaera sp.]|uniref:PEP-CTERM sorting domain-containing protein n=1 Tax=Crocosphaera sp. TaxID=2729996 RepID=UPI003F2855C0|nr:PEP-CTERM sorting domain-containing protein [Crocosphaera sp.]